MDDLELLREFASRSSEEAFRELVDRHTNLVYSVALRQVHNPHLAKEVTQVVFIALAQKAHQLQTGTILAGWLFRATRYAALKAVRTESRYHRRVEEAARMETLPQTSDSKGAWEQIVPILNEAIDHLGEKDRNALLLRFFRGHNFKEVARTLGATEDAAKMRVSRALDKLRRILAQRGVVLPVTVLAAAIWANATQGCSRWFVGHSRERRPRKRGDHKRFNCDPSERNIETYGMD